MRRLAAGVCGRPAGSGALRRRSRLTLPLHSPPSFFYTTTKNPTNNVNKLVLKKYDPIVRRHVLFQESKMPTSKGGRKV